MTHVLLDHNLLWQWMLLSQTPAVSFSQYPPKDWRTVQDLPKYYTHDSILRFTSSECLYDSALGWPFCFNTGYTNAAKSFERWSANPRQIIFGSDLF